MKVLGVCKRSFQERIFEVVVVWLAFALYPIGTDNWTTLLLLIVRCGPSSALSGILVFLDLGFVPRSNFTQGLTLLIFIIFGFYGREFL